MDVVISNLFATFLTVSIREGDTVLLRSTDTSQCRVHTAALDGVLSWGDTLPMLKNEAGGVTSSLEVYKDVVYYSHESSNPSLVCVYMILPNRGSRPVAFTCTAKMTLLF